MEDRGRVGEWAEPEQSSVVGLQKIDNFHFTFRGKLFQQVQFTIFVGITLTELRKGACMVVGKLMGYEVASTSSFKRGETLKIK